ncbi:Glycoside hydrolase, family 28, partial [Dillenia turbinata]
ELSYSLTIFNLQAFLKAWDAACGANGDVQIVIPTGTFFLQSLSFQGPCKASSLEIQTYGAVGDGKTDDSNAFIKAWQDACEATQGVPTIVIPNETFLLQPLQFLGPCKPKNIHFQDKFLVILLLQQILKCGIPLVMTEAGLLSKRSHGNAHGHPRAQNILNVKNYGAVGDGEIDDSNAFIKAWQDACNATQGVPTIVIPNATFLLQPLQFLGPCKPKNIHFQVLGDIVAPATPEVWNPTCYEGSWINFRSVDGLILDGSGKLDGNGQGWWKRKRRPTGNVRPTAMPMATHGDDCIAINSNSSYVNITGIRCGPGHGISIGSLGHDGSTEVVEEVHVKNCTFNGTQNGARIKTWQGGLGYARRISFDDIMFYNTGKPIFIDQFYCPHMPDRCAPKVSDVTFSNVLGTSATKDAIIFNCSAAVP